MPDGRQRIDGEMTYHTISISIGRRTLAPQGPVNAYVARFIATPALAARVVAVFERLPHHVLDDLMNDALFRLAVDEWSATQGRRVWLHPPVTVGRGSRCVVLKPHLATCAEAFAHYVIAHEAAHAYLRNGGWGAIPDPELAADALAANWGFPRPDSAVARWPLVLSVPLPIAAKHVD